MALDSLCAEFKTITRSEGRSSVAAAAYRAGDRIEDERTGKLHDYTRKTGVIHGEYVLPEEVDASKLYKDRGEYWNKVEEVNTRSNAKLARDFMVPLPHELNKEQMINLSRDIAQYLADRHQVFTDFAIHAPHKDANGNSNNNFHVHIMMSTNQITNDGFRTSKSKTVGGKTVRYVPLDYSGKRGSDEAKAIRKDTADLINKYLEEAGSDARTHSGSYKDRGLDTLPQKKQGKAVTYLERAGVNTEIGDYNRRVKVANDNAKQQVFISQQIIDIKQQLEAIKDKTAGKQGFTQQMKQNYYTYVKPEQEREVDDFYYMRQAEIKSRLDKADKDQ